jgi:membrane protease YdiL (CAAX protease family)
MWLFAAIIVFVTLASAQQFVAQQAWLTGGDPGSIRGLGATAVGVYVLTLIVAVGMLTLFSRSASGAGLKTVSSDIPLGIGCLLLALPAVFLSSELMVLMHERITGDEIAAVAHPMLRKITEHPDDPWMWGLILAAVVGAPVVEEIIYRGFLQSAILRWTQMPWWAILVTAAAFTAVHALGDEPVEYYALAPIFVLGVAMGLAYEKTRHIGVPIVMHMGFNALNIGIALYASQGGADSASTAMGI